MENRLNVSVGLDSNVVFKNYNLSCRKCVPNITKVSDSIVKSNVWFLGAFLCYWISCGYLVPVLYTVSVAA